MIIFILRLCVIFNVSVTYLLSCSNRAFKCGCFAACVALATSVLPAVAQIPLDGVRQVATGYAHTCVLTATGGVKCWGTRGAVGDGSSSLIDMRIGVDVVGLVDGVSAIVAGSNHNCALLNTGEVKCWGGNDDGQLGNNTVIRQRTPIDLIGLSDGVSALALGDGYTCVLTNSGSVKCSGRNTHGQLGDGTIEGKLILTNTAGLSDVTAISAGAAHTCVLTSVGGVKCWGWNGYGQLGNGTITSSSTPVDVYGLSSGVIKIDAGVTHTCAVLVDGNVKCWGKNQYGKLGNGATTQANIPVDVIGLGAPVTDVIAGESHTCALTNSGGVKCWGNNARGQLGNNSVTTSMTPRDTIGLTEGVVSLSSYDWHSCVTTNLNGIKCWGSNTYGQLGTGTSSDAFIPATPVQAFAPVMVVASPGDREVRVSFSPPTTDSGYPVTSYTIELYSIDAYHAYVDTVGPDERSYLVTGLTNGVPYSFAVTATNALGTGLPKVSNNVIPSGSSSSAPASTSSMALSSSSITSSLPASSIAASSLTASSVGISSVASSSSSIATSVASSSVSSVDVCSLVTEAAFGTTYSGTLATTDCTGGARGTSYYTDRYSFTGTPGQLIAIQLSGAFDTYVNLKNPSGIVIASNDDGGGGTNSRIPATSGNFTIPAGATGTYVIEVTSYSSLATGTYSLTVTSAAAASSSSVVASSSASSVSSSVSSANPCNTVVTVVSGVTNSGTLATTDCTTGVRGAGYYTDRYSFAGTSGQLVSIQLTSSAFDTFVYLKNPSGTVITSNDDGGGGTNSRIPATSGNFTLPASGTFVIEVTSYSTQRTGAYSLLFTRQ